MNLYAITQEFQNIFNQISEDGEITEAIIQNMDELHENFETKAVSIASLIKNIEAEENAISQAIEAMKDRRATLTKKAQSLSDYLQCSLQSMSISEIKSSPYFKIRLKKCPPSIDVYDEKVIPAEFWREKVVTSVDKIKLKEAMTEGVEVPGAAIQRKLKLEIK